VIDRRLARVVDQLVVGSCVPGVRVFPASAWFLEASVGDGNRERAGCAECAHEDQRDQAECYVMQLHHTPLWLFERSGVLARLGGVRGSGGPEGLPPLLLALCPTCHRVDGTGRRPLG
jgi:hypothetical protein